MAYRISIASRGIFCYGTRTLVVAQGLQGVRAQSAVVVRGLSCLTAGGMLVPPPGIEPATRSTARRMFNLWTSREVPSHSF